MSHLAHTFFEWKQMGYCVRLGAKSFGKDARGRALFRFEDVEPVAELDDDPEFDPSWDSHKDYFP